MLIDDTILRLQVILRENLKTIVRFILPFGTPKENLLVVLQKKAPKVSTAYTAVGIDVLKQVNLLCLRETDLFQLALPSPDVAALSRPYWIKYDGTVIFGDDIRSIVTLHKNPHRLLAYHCDWVYASRHRILDYLIQHRYQELFSGLYQNQLLLMCTALLQRRIWRVYPETVATQFTEIFPDEELAHNLRAFRDLQGRDSELHPFTEETALKSAWLFESFVRRLRELSK
jgi:hypothetical protein